MEYLFYIILLCGVYLLTAFISIGIYFLLCYENIPYIRTNFNKLIFYPGMNLIWSVYFLYNRIKKTLIKMNDSKLNEPFKYLK